MAGAAGVTVLLLFCDSFNHYSNLSDKWDFPFGGSIINNPAIARTGSQCLTISGGSQGPVKNLGTGLQVVQYPQLIQGVALNFDPISSATDVLHFEFVAAGAQVANVIVSLNPDGSFSVFRGAGDTVQTLLGSTAAGLFVFRPGAPPLWNYLEAKVTVSHTVGFVELRFAPAPAGPMAVVLTLTNQNTAAFAVVPWNNQVHVDGPGAINHNPFFADYYCLDWSTPPNNNYLGGVKIFADTPFANGSPVQFTPLALTNWQEVSEIPPDGDTSYNSSGTVGATDQYQHNLGPTPVGSQIQAVQHVMDLRIDAGSRSVTSNVGGVLNPNAIFLPNTYSMLTYPYDTNPVTGLPWKITDFPGQFGPAVVS